MKIFTKVLSKGQQGRGGETAKCTCERHNQRSPARERERERESR